MEGLIWPGLGWLEGGGRGLILGELGMDWPGGGSGRVSGRGACWNTSLHYYL